MVGGGPSTQAQIGDTVVYYVDQDGGDNSNSGLATDAAWATLGYADSNAVTKSNPVIIALEPGDTWALDNVHEITNGGDGGNLVIWDGNYYLWGGGADAIILSNSDGGDSPKYYSLVHIVACQYLTFQNITVDCNNTSRHGLTVGGSTTDFGPTTQANESHITIQDCEVLDCGDETAYRNAFVVRPINTDMDNITVQRNTIDGTSNNALVFYTETEIEGVGISDSYIGYNTVTNAGRDDDGVSTYIGLMNKCTDVIIEYNTITTGVNGHKTGMSVDRNTTLAGQYSTGIIIRYNNVRIDDGPEPAFLIQGRATVNTPFEIDVYGNLFYSKATGEVLNGWATRITAGGTLVGAVLNFDFNTMVTEGGTTFRDDGDEDGITNIQNNIFMNDGAGGDYENSCVQIDSAVGTHTNNLYYRHGVAGDQVTRIDGTYYDPAPMQAFEATAVITDPTFTTEFTNLHLQTGSPALDAGVAIDGITLDIEGVELGSPPNIGAFETVEDP